MLPRAVLLVSLVLAVSAAVAVHAQYACAFYSGSCSACSYAPAQCGWCSTGSSSTSSVNAACRAGTASGPTSNYCSGDWYPPGYALSTCPVAPTTCSDITTCSSCTPSTLNCGWCVRSGGLSPTCMSLSGSCVGQFFTSAGLCPVPPPSCGSASSCSACNGISGCGWCTGSNTCGLSSVCPLAACPAAPGPSGPSQPGGEPPGTFSPISNGGTDGNGKRYFYAGSPSSDSNSRAAIPLLTFTLISFIIGLICVSCVDSFTPKVASKVGQIGMFPRMAANRTIVGLALIAEGIVFLLILVACGVNTWTIYTFGSGSRQTTLSFGVYSVTASSTATTYTAWYSCDLSDGASDDYKKQCGAFLGGCVMTMFYEMFFSISALAALVLMGLGAHRQRYTASIYKAHAIATVAAVTALFNWALCPHLILTSELNAFENQQGGTTSGTLGFGPSWGLLIPIFLFAVVLGMFWRAVIETLPAVPPAAAGAGAGAVPAAGVPVASPQQFSDPTTLEQNPYLAQQQIAQGQAQFAPQMTQPQTTMVAVPAAYASGMEQQGMGAGYVAPEAAPGGFAQI